MASTVLICPPEYRSKLLEQVELRDATVFSDDDTLRALDSITQRRPSVIVLERTFAASSRGLALVARLKADPALAACEIRIVAPGSAPIRPAATQPDSASDPPATIVIDMPRDFDVRGTRRVERVQIADGVEVLVEGLAATLVDLSTLGAQVTSLTILRPNQRLRLSLPGAAGVIRVSATVAWAAFEMPKEGPRYRAGLEFVLPDTAALEEFCATHKR